MTEQELIERTVAETLRQLNAGSPLPSAGTEPAEVAPMGVEEYCELTDKWHYGMKILTALTGKCVSTLKTYHAGIQPIPPSVAYRLRQLDKVMSEYLSAWQELDK